ncbi:hypothetical protein BD410DRAFT_373377 [Rickenella mellea]|uniref:Fungal-type protein kinase domain-containing protein n=1 Tax=Rickenella mellea TaxID=50990 RepID=A0A4Y7PZI1_9AGAM|nr:hypothetical protein BD410DRAFT_373377 [Rickenella mellea]
MYYRSEDGTIVGVLGDFDLSVHWSSQDRRTRTLPFTALELLRAGRRPHLYRHDVESLFHVLVWIAARFNDGKEVNPDALRGWCKNAKSSMLTKAVFTSEIGVLKSIVLTTQFQPLFETWLKPIWMLFLHGYWNLNLSNAGTPGVVVDHETLGITFEKVIEILKPRAMT